MLVSCVGIPSHTAYVRRLQLVQYLERQPMPFQALVASMQQVLWWPPTGCLYAPPPKQLRLDNRDTCPPRKY